MKYTLAIFVLMVLLVACQPAIPPVGTPSPVTAPVSPVIAPPQSAPPKIVEKVTTFEAVKYADPTYKFSVAYPSGWTPAPAKLKGGVFYAIGPNNNIVYIAVRPTTSFRDAANTYMSDLIALTGILLTQEIDSETNITLADGTKADVILMSIGGGRAKAVITGVIKDGNAIMICGAMNPKNLELYAEIGSTLLVQTTLPETSLAQPGDNKTTQVVPASTDQATSFKVLFDRQGIMYSANVDGSGQKRISNPADMSPDGKTRVIAAQTDFNYRALYLVNADGSNKKPIIPIGGGLPDHNQPAWSPDGSKIAFDKSKPYMGSGGFLFYDIWVINPDGTGLKKISNDSSTGNPRSHVSAKWFPDGQQIAFASNESGVWEIYSTPIDRFESKLLVKLQQTFLMRGGQGFQIPYDFKISRDGKRLIYRDGLGSDLKTLVLDLGTSKTIEWPNIDTSQIAPVKSQDGIVTVITSSDGLYYTDNVHKDPLKIPSTIAGDVAMGFAE